MCRVKQEKKEGRKTIVAKQQIHVQRFSTFPSHLPQTQNKTKLHRKATDTGRIGTMRILNITLAYLFDVLS